MKTSSRISISISICAALATVAAGAAEPAVPAAVRELVRSVDYEPGWSPDGESLVVVSNRSGAMNLYRLAANGGAPRRLTDHAGPDDTPAWSPDGRTVAFVSEIDGNPEIYLVDADGANLRRLTADPGLDLHPAWSPDSTRILFNTSRFAATPADPDRIDLCEVAVAGGTLRCFTQGGINTYASWSPDGARLLYRRSRGDDRSQLVLLTVASGELVELTPGEAFDGWPSWSPRGDRVVFASDRSREFQLYVVDARDRRAGRRTLLAGAAAAGPRRERAGAPRGGPAPNRPIPRAQRTATFSAAGPFWPWTTSNSTR